MEHELCKLGMWFVTSFPLCKAEYSLHEVSLEFSLVSSYITEQFILSHIHLSIYKNFPGKKQAPAHLQDLQ